MDTLYDRSGRSRSRQESWFMDRVGIYGSTEKLNRHGSESTDGRVESGYGFEEFSNGGIE